MSRRGAGAAPALLFLVRRSLRNRAVSLVGKLRHIPYLLAVLAGLALFTLWLVPYLVLRGQGDVEATLLSAPSWTMSLAALGLAGLAFYWWTLGKYHRVLAFSPAETDLLISGPVRRRTLITYKLARSQLGIVLGVLWIGLFVDTGVGWPLRLVGAWLLFTTLHLHQVAAALVRTSVFRSVGGLRRHAVPLVVFGAVLTVVLVTTTDAAPGVVGALGAADFGTASRLVAEALDRPVPRLVLLPARMVLAPVFADGRDAWLAALPGAVALLVLHFVWVLRTDAAFEEEAAAAGQKQKDLKDTVMKEGLFASMAGVLGDRRSRRRPFRLRPGGRPWVALTWKNLTMGFRSLGPRMFVWILIVVAPTFFLELGEGSNGVLAVVGTILAGFAAMLVVIGPFVVRNDLRTDLGKAELLRTYPLEGRTVVGATVLASTLSLTLLQYLLGVPALLLLLPTLEDANPGTVLAVAGAVVAFLPVVNALLLLVQNGMALFFPAWVPVGQVRTGGIDQLGTTVLMWTATFLLMIPATLPPLLVGGGAAALLWAPLGAVPASGAGALAAWLVLAGEAVGLVHLLGEQWDEMDVVEAGLLR